MVTLQAHANNVAVLKHALPAITYVAKGTVSGYDACGMCITCNRQLSSHVLLGHHKAIIAKGALDLALGAVNFVVQGSDELKFDELIVEFTTLKNLGMHEQLNVAGSNIC